MSRTRSAFLGTISSQFYTIISILASLFSVPIIVKHLNGEIYGLSIIIFQITAYLGMFDFGLIAGVERYLAGTRDDTKENRELIQKIISTAVVVYGFIAIIVIIGGNVFAPFAAKVFNAPANYIQTVNHIVSALSILLGFQLIQRAITAIFFAHQRQILHNTLSFILNIGNTILTIIFISQGYGLWGFVYSQIVMFILSSLANIYFFNKYYSYVSINVKKFDWPLVKDMFSYGFSLFLIGIAVQVVFQTDRIIIGSFVSLTAVSIYSFTTKIPELTSQVIWKVSDNSFPAMVELSQKEDGKIFLRSSHNKIMKLTISFTSTLFWIIVLTSYPFIKLWVGSEYYAGTRFTIFVAYLYLIQLTFIHVTSVCLNSLGIAKKISAMALVEAAINLTLSLILVKRYGIEGVIIATIIGSVLTSFWYVPYLAVKHFSGNMFSYILTLLKPVLICSVFDGIFYLLLKNKFHNINSWFTLAVDTLVISLLCMVPVVVLNRLVFSELKGMFFNRRRQA